jgi:hypothetical protein
VQSAMSGIEGLAASGLTSRSTLSRILPGSCSPSCASSMILAAMASLTPVSPFSLRSWQTLTNASVMASVVSGSNTGWPLMNGKILCIARFLICGRYLIHGAPAVLPYLVEQKTPLSRWACELLARAHKNVVVVALANKLARIAWVVLARGGVYNCPASCRALAETRVFGSKSIS